MTQVSDQSLALPSFKHIASPPTASPGCAPERCGLGPVRAISFHRVLRSAAHGWCGRVGNRPYPDDPAFYLLALSELGEHDNEGYVFLPHHLPEVCYSVGHWALGGNVDLLFPIIALRRQSTEGRRCCEPTVHRCWVRLEPVNINTHTHAHIRTGSHMLEEDMGPTMRNTLSLSSCPSVS